MTAFKDVGNRAFSYGLAQIGFRAVLRHSVPHLGSHYDLDDRGAAAMLQKMRPTEWLVEVRVLTTEGTGDTEGNPQVLDSA